MRKNSRISVLLLTLIAGGIALAAAPSPQQVVDETVKAMSKALEGRKEHFQANQKELYTLVDKVLLPHFDTRYAAQIVLGKHWKTANDAQRQRFIDSFYNFLLRSYAKAILRFDQNNIKIMPARSEPQDGRAVVETTMRLDDGSTSPVNYSVHLKDGDWKVYDVRIEGVSYVQNYRNQFNEEIAAKGIDAVIQRLEKETAAIDAGKEPENSRGIAEKIRRQIVAIAVFTADGDGSFSVSGPVTFETVTKLWRSSHGKFDNGAAARIDLGGITEIDSAGLSLLVEWVRWARRQAGSISYEHPPAKLLALARIGDVDQLLSIGPVAATQK